MCYRAEQSRAEQSRAVISSKYFAILEEAENIVGIKFWEMEWKSLGEVGEFINGSGLSKDLFKENGEIGAIHYGHIYTKYSQNVYETLVKIRKEDALKLKKVKIGDLVIAKTSENLEDVMKTIVYLGEQEVVFGGHAAVFRHNQNAKYLGYLFNGLNDFKKQKNKIAKGVKVIEVSTKDMEKIKILLPPLVIQKYVVSILDPFHKIVNDLKEGLPKEIELRQKQYEYYREKLLDFKRLD